jgi:hypothetical protein
MNILEWVQDSIAYRQVSRVSQYFPQTSNDSNQNALYGDESTISKSTKFASVDGDEFSKRASETLADSAINFAETLWDAPEELDPINCQRFGDQDEQATGVEMDRSNWTPPFTLLGTGVVQGPSESKFDPIDRVTSFRDFICRPLSCMPNPYEPEGTGKSQNARGGCESPLDVPSKMHGNDHDVLISDAGERDGSPSGCKLKQEVTPVSTGTESVARKAVRESLQRRQAELIEAAVHNYSETSIANRNNEEPESHSQQSHFLNGRTKRVTELLKAAEARFEARLNPTPASAGPLLDKEADDEILA